MPIAQLGVDAIVNAANADLCSGDGVHDAIHRAAGPRLRHACQQLHGCELGRVKVTDGFGLPARYVIHAVGPKRGEYEKNLGYCYLKALDEAVRLGAKSVAFPCISGGTEGLGAETAARIALSTVQRWLSLGENDKLDEIVFAVASRENETAFGQLWPAYFPETERPADTREEPQPRRCRRSECGERYVGLQAQRCPRCDARGWNTTPAWTNAAEALGPSPDHWDMPEQVRSITMEPEERQTDQRRTCRSRQCGREYLGSRRSGCTYCGWVSAH